MHYNLMVDFSQTFVIFSLFLSIKKLQEKQNWRKYKYFLIYSISRIKQTQNIIMWTYNLYIYIYKILFFYS